MTEQIAFIPVLILGAALVIALLGARLTKIERRISRLSPMEAKLNLLLMHSGLEYDPYRDLPPKVVEAIEQGNKIEAIKRYREAKAVDLKEAKKFIEEVQRRSGVV